MTGKAITCEAGTCRPYMEVCGLVDKHDRRGPHPPTSREMAAKVAQIQYLDRDVDTPILSQIQIPMVQKSDIRAPQLRLRERIHMQTTT